MTTFVHLHAHSDFSLLDGAARIDSIIESAQKNNMSAVALTEHGNLFSAIEFYKKAKKANIKPILGCEVYVAKGSRFDRTPRKSGGFPYHHLTLLVQNEQGYHNLIRLVSMGYLEGFYYRPRVDYELLEKYSDGLISLSGCMKSVVSEAHIQYGYDKAKEEALQLSRIFPDRFFLEIQNHGMPEQKIICEGNIRLSQEVGIPIVASNDFHYIDKSHASAHDAMICIGMGKDIEDINRIRYHGEEFYLKTAEEMLDLFPEVPEAIENTQKIADMCNLEIDTKTYHLPNFEIPEDSHIESSEEYLVQLVWEGAKNRYSEIDENLTQRIENELSVINAMGFSGYFLITADFVKYARNHQIAVGPGRGSAAGSVVAYCLEITEVDPIKYGLIFERFLNPDRISMPDVDIDFCYERRQEVIDYIKKKYGENAVSQIITFGTMKARAVIRDVGRVLKLSYGEVDKIAKMIPFGIDVTLKTAFEQNPELKEIEKTSPKHKQLMDYSHVLEGMARHASTHAAGVVIAPGDILDYAPLYKSSQSGDITTQWDMKSLETVGLLKMDFLGLRTLTVLDRTVQAIRENGDEIPLNLNQLPLDDKKVYELFTKGYTIGIFQFESSGMRECLRKLKPTEIEDLIAMNALYRPGPMQNIDEFIARRHGKKQIKVIHERLKPILENTYGIIVYQEQVMQIAHEIGGFTLAKSDLMRRAMGKKLKKEMKTYRKEFIGGAQKNGLTKTQAGKIFDLLEKFAEYGFNKSHSTAYALLAYQSAYLKTYFPSEFMAASLTSEMYDSDRIFKLTNECRIIGLKLDSPDVNRSAVGFFADSKVIYFGLNAIKNVGKKAALSIVEQREKDGKYKSLFDLCKRVDLRLVNRRVLESLICAGALDSLPGNRAQKLQSLETTHSSAQIYQQNKDANQFDLFGGGSVSEEIIAEPELPNVPDWKESERLSREKAVIGFYLTGHPLDTYEEDIQTFCNYGATEEQEKSNPENVKTAGVIQDVKIHQDRKNNPMAFVTLETIRGLCEIMVFSETFQKYRHLIEPDAKLFVQGKSSNRDKSMKIMADQFIPLDDIRKQLARRLFVRLDPKAIKPDVISEFRNLAGDFHGNCEVIFRLIEEENSQQNIRSKTVRVFPHRKLMSQLRNTYGKKNVWFT